MVCAHVQGQSGSQRIAWAHHPGLLQAPDQFQRGRGGHVTGGPGRSHRLPEDAKDAATGVGTSRTFLLHHAMRSSCCCSSS